MVKIGKGSKTNLIGNAQYLFIRAAQQTRGFVQAIFIQIAHKAGARCILKPAHKMAGAAISGCSSLIHADRLSIFPLDIINHALQARRIRLICSRGTGLQLQQLKDAKTQLETMEKTMVPLLNALDTLLEQVQTADMVRHETLAEQVYRTTYSNGCAIVVNYSDEAYTVGATQVEPMGFALVKDGERN